MGEQPQKHKISVGLLAHVDAGKTTLAEGMLYTAGQIRNMGRVDHKDAYLDHFAMERDRGITIFSKQARLTWKELEVNLLDTPGHVDFSAEMERTLQVLDYAILIINGADGVQGHTGTLWRLLEKYELPVFLFVNKMDQTGTDKEALMQELKDRLSERCVCFDSEEGEGFWDDLSLCSEGLLEECLEKGRVSRETLDEAILNREVFPCYFGAALRLEGVERLLDGLNSHCMLVCYDEDKEFGARVYKITRDNNNNRLTHLKITGGGLRAKQVISNWASAAKEEERWQEKVDQIRLYNGMSYTTTDRVEAGEICAVLGLTGTFVGEGLGFEAENAKPVLEPLMTYQLILPEGCDPVIVLGQLRQLEEEDPLLHVVWKQSVGEIHVQVMGDIQVEVLKNQLAERFGVEAEFASGSIVYKETIKAPVIGVGHYEPLRHYAEVHVRMEPGEPGSGIRIGSQCSRDELDLNWQRLIMTHLGEKRFAGVLTGAELTDVKFTIVNGRAHQKHTEGGDFRQATYRSVRQGLMKAESVLLEPMFAFSLELPAEHIGRAMSDVQRMKGSFEPPVYVGERVLLTGRVSVAAMKDYSNEVKSYTGGEGRLALEFAGYEPCHNTEEVLAGCSYDPEADTENPSSSVFCAHGAGFVVPWYQVEDYAHLESGPAEEQFETAGAYTEAAGEGVRMPVPVPGENNRYISQEEIDAIFATTYGKPKEDKKHFRRYHITHKDVLMGVGNGETVRSTGMPGGSQKNDSRKETCLLVDGYNIIFAWPKLRELAAINLDSARDQLMDILSNYQGTLGGQLILVFDAYKVKNNPGSLYQYHNIHVVFTREAQTADAYIEKTVHEIADKFRVTVATSDALEQMIVWGAGATRLSALGLLDEVNAAARKLREEYHV